MHILVTGAGGLVGHDMVHQLHTRGHLVTGAYHNRIEPGTDGLRLDITDRESVRETICRLRPDAVIHCAAWTAVDAAEDSENLARVRAVNTEGTRNVALACREAGCKLLYFSTDYVFSGEGTIPWSPDCADFSPLNVYGQTKLEGEQAVRELLERYYILRISWVFGSHGKNFVSTMLELGKKHSSLRVINDQIGTPTYTRDLARLAADMVETAAYGIYHVTNEGGYISWYDFACEIFRQAGIPMTVHPVTTAEYGLSKAARPFNSRLDKNKLTECGFCPLPDWKEALARYLKVIDIS